MIKSDKRNEIIQAAVRLIAKHGFHGTPISMIAEKARVGAGTIYRYFKNKDELILEIYREMEEKLMTALQIEDYSKRSVREKFLHVGTTLLKYFLKHPLYFRFMEQYHNSPYGEALRREKLFYRPGDEDIFVELINQGIAEQELKDLPLFVHAALIFGPVVVLVRDHVHGLVALDDDLVNRSIEACWDGIRRQVSV